MENTRFKPTEDNKLSVFRWEIFVFIQRNRVILPQTVNNKHNKSMFYSTKKKKTGSWRLFLDVPDPEQKILYSACFSPALLRRERAHVTNQSPPPALLLGNVCLSGLTFAVPAS